MQHYAIILYAVHLCRAILSSTGVWPIITTRMAFFRKETKWQRTWRKGWNERTGKQYKGLQLKGLAFN